MSAFHGLSRQLYLWTLGLLGLLLFAALREVFFIAFFAVLLAVLLDWPVRLVGKVLPRGVAVVMTLLFGLGCFGALGYATYAPLSEQWTRLEQQLPQAVTRARGWFEHVKEDTPLAPLIPAGSKPGKAPGPGLSEAGSLLSLTGKAAISVTSTIAAVVVLIVLAAFFVHEPRTYREGLRALVPKKQEEEFDVVWSKLSVGLRHWLGGALVSMTLMGCLTALGLALAGVQDWFLFGILTFLGTFIPYLGAIASALPGLAFALSQSTTTFLWALLVYIIVHHVEGYLVQPIVMRRAVIIRPATLLVWQLVMGTLAGVPGIIVATPLLACFKIILGELYIHRYLGKRPAPV